MHATSPAEPRPAGKHIAKATRMLRLSSRIHGNTQSAMTRGGCSGIRLARVWSMWPGIITTKPFGYGIQPTVSKATSGKGWISPRLQTTRRIDRDSQAQALQVHRAPVGAAASLARSGRLIKLVLPCRLASGTVPHLQPKPAAVYYRTGCTGASSFPTTGSLYRGRAARSYHPVRSR